MKKLYCEECDSKIKAGVAMGDDINYCPLCGSQDIERTDEEA